MPATGTPFATTHWSVIAACRGGEGDAPGAEAALAQLCRDYWAPLYTFVRRRGASPHDAQDLIQGFFAHLLAKQLYTQADPELGKFRSFLLTVLKRYLSDARDREQAQKRGGGRQFVFLDAEIGKAEALFAADLSGQAPRDEERAFEWDWASSLISRAMSNLAAEYAEGSRAQVFETLQPFLTGGVGLPTPEQAAERLGVPLATLRSHLSRLRSRYRELLRAEVARTVATAGEVDAELRYLCQVLVATV